MAQLDSDTVKKVGCVYKGVHINYDRPNQFTVAISSISVVSQTPPNTYSDLPVPSVVLSNIPDDGTLGESVNDGIPLSQFLQISILILLYLCHFSKTLCVNGVN